MHLSIEGHIFVESEKNDKTCVIHFGVWCAYIILNISVFFLII